MARLLWIALVTMLAAWSRLAFGAEAQDECIAARYQGAIYIALDDLASALGGSIELTRGARELRIQVGDKTWELANGGDRVVGPDGKTRMLKRPALVLSGRQFMTLEEASTTFAFAVENGSAAAIRIDGRRWTLEPLESDSKYQGHRIESLRAIHETVVTVGELAVRPALHVGSAAQVLPAERILLIRRAFSLDGVAHNVVTDCGEAPRSYVVAESELRGKTRSTQLDTTLWKEYREQFERQMEPTLGLQQGNPAALRHSVAVTIDLCWSLRAYEKRFFESLPVLARRQKHVLHPVLFVSGRWLEQHPTEMHDLVELDHDPNVEFIWGLHSWAHPKSGGFMNDYSPKAVARDTLRLEQQLLEWGIVPSVYYRFPGLIHDRTRTQAILDLDLLPIDCDCWMALVNPSRPTPFYHPVRDGSIILVHGNGNEAQGIQAFDQWLVEHADWRWAPLHEFLPRK